MARPTSTTSPAAECACAPHAPSTNTFSLLSFIFAFIAAPLGAVFGVLGLKQLKTTGESGRNYAIAGLVISGVNMLVAVTAGSLMLLGLLLGASHHAQFEPGSGYMQTNPYDGSGYVVPAGSYDLSGTGSIASGAPTGVLGMPSSPAQG